MGGSSEEKGGDVPARECGTKVRIEARFAEGEDSLGESVETEDDRLVGSKESVEGVSVESVRVRSRLAEDHLRD